MKEEMQLAPGRGGVAMPRRSVFLKPLVLFHVCVRWRETHSGACGGARRPAAWAKWGRHTRPCPGQEGPLYMRIMFSPTRLHPYFTCKRAAEVGRQARPEGTRMRDARKADGEALAASGTCSSPLVLDAC